jgi:wyosine [tRNA(Phe)-imidazoG37] synthetase (radical SAM superfamily)
MTHNLHNLTSVYGPVKSWRYGRSLGIDPIGSISTCSFNCVYCQLGDIQHHTTERQNFIPTEQIIRDLQTFAPWDVDVVTLSGSGEPTQALNLREILTQVKQLAGRTTVVLTNSTFLGDPGVRSALELADIVAAKLDAVSSEQLRRVNRPAPGIDWSEIISGIAQFRQEYRGHLAIQTMILSPWSFETQAEYTRLMQHIMPDEIQLNTPTRPRSLSRQMETRGNHTQNLPYPVQNLKHLSPNLLQTLATQIQTSTGIVVRCPPL